MHTHLGPRHDAGVLIDGHEVGVRPLAVEVVERLALLENKKSGVSCMINPLVLSCYSILSMYV